MKRGLSVALLLSLGVIGLCLFWLKYAPSFFQGDYNKASDAGSMFGFVSALFTGLGFVGLVYTLILQREQLSNAKVEGEEARKTGERQRFENTFFRLLQLHTGIVDSLKMEKSAQRYFSPDNPGHVWHYQGRDVLFVLESELRQTLSDVSWKNWQLDPKNGGGRRGFLEEKGETWYARHSDRLDHYFRVLYRIIRQIDDSKIDDKQRYGKILRAQLSRQELFLLFYNALIERGAKMKIEIEKYAFLKHLPLENLADVSDDDFYEESARVGNLSEKSPDR